MTHAAATLLSLVPVEAAPAQPVQPEGPGWFDSSWILRAGLEVREGFLGDAALNGWIERWLQPAGGSALSFSAT
jgi:hypothetical protein